MSAIEKAALYVLSQHAEDALPTEADDPDFEASYAKAQAAMEAQQSLEELRPLTRKWGLN